MLFAPNSWCFPYLFEMILRPLLNKFFELKTFMKKSAKPRVGAWSGIDEGSLHQNRLHPKQSNSCCDQPPGVETTDGFVTWDVNTMVSTCCGDLPIVAVATAMASYSCEELPEPWERARARTQWTSIPRRQNTVVLHHTHTFPPNTSLYQRKARDTPVVSGGRNGVQEVVSHGRPRAENLCRSPGNFSFIILVASCY